MRLRRFAILVAVLTLPAAFALAQTTGSMAGRVADESGGVLPGVTVEARSPALQGVRAATTDAAGRYRLTILPPGLYEVTFTLAGFAPETKKGVTVGLGKDTTLDATLRPAAKEAVVVSAQAPVVDTTSTTLGENFGERAMQTLPTARNYSSITQTVPGVSSDADSRNTTQQTITVYGSSGAENAFYIDGMNTTGMEYGFQGKSLNYDFIQEVNVQTGGYEAEYGRSTGGIINVITKSGGNEFHGDVFGYFSNASLQATAEPVATTTTVDGFSRYDYGAALGGYILKDRLWFFGAYDRVQNNTTNATFFGASETTPAITVHSQSNSTSNLGSAKLTFAITPSQNLIASYIQDPLGTTGAINDPDHPLYGLPLTYNGDQALGGRDYSVRYQGVFGASWVATVQWARHQEKNNVGPATAAGDVIQYQDAANNFFQTGGFGLTQNKNFTRDFYGGSLTKFLGQHEIKFGVEYEKENADVVKRESGGQLVTVYQNTVNPSQPIYSHFYWTTPDATTDPFNAPISQLNSFTEHRNLTLFLQDRWAILPNLTLNVGLRWDQQQIYGSDPFTQSVGQRQVNLNQDFAPRVGVIWDPSMTHRAKVFGSYGKYYEEIPMDLVIRSFSFERQPRVINFDPTSVVPDPQAEADYGTSSAILGGATEPSDPNMKGQYINEYIIGGEYEFATNWAVGLKGVYRSYGRVIEDFLCSSDGTYCIGNPGSGPWTTNGQQYTFQQIFTLDYSTTYPTPKPQRIYRGIQLDVTKRFADNWQMIASYVYSTLKGNFDGEYSPFTQDTLNDPNISAAYDYYDFFTNGSNLNVITNTGYLSNDRRNQFKLSALYLFPFKLQVGLTGYYRTGTPWTRYGYSDAYGRYEFFLTTRGAEGRMPSNYEADLHLGYPIAIGPVDVNLIVDVFSIFNAQRAIVLDQRWGFQEADNSSPTPVNPSYGQPILRTPPTVARFGVRVSF
jgi:outer membrane receptor protein involved in Fe transport